MIKVLHFELTKNHGGIESLLLRVSKEVVQDKNIHFDFITKEQVKLPYEDDLLALGCNIYRVPSEKNLIGYVKAINKILKKNNYDVVHVHKNSLINIVPIILAKHSNVKKIIVHSHNTASTRGGRLFRYIHYINRAYIVNTSVVKVACSKMAKDWMFGSAEDVLYIPNGVDLSVYSKDEQARKNIRTEFNVQENEILLGTVGRLTKQKNQEFLIDVLSKLDERFKVIIVGKGELREKLSQKINASSLSDRIYLAGEREDIPAILQGIDAFVMPSLHEGLPIAGIEAQAAGLPLVVSKNISNELNISGNVKFIELDSDLWARTLKNMNYTRNENIKSNFIKVGYDIQVTKKKFLELYHS